MAAKDKALRPEADLDNRSISVRRQLVDEDDDQEDPRVHSRPSQLWARQDAGQGRAPDRKGHDVLHVDAPPEHQQQSDAVKRIHTCYSLADLDATSIAGTLIPAYQHARDARDTESVAEIGGRLIATFSRMHGAKAALAELGAKTPRHSVPGSSVDEDLEQSRLQHEIDAKGPGLDSRIKRASLLAMVALTPHEFRGEAVAGVGPVPDMEGPPGQIRARLAGELDRTLGMLALVHEITTVIGARHAKLDRRALDRARNKLWSWVTRPIDLAFLKAALGPDWNVLDATATPDQKPSAALDAATKQAHHTGWFGDIGQFNIDDVIMWLRLGSADNAEVVLYKLYSADPDTRARLLVQMRERKLLDKLCSSVGWASIKELHDSLGNGFGDIKTDLQRYFIGGKDKWGPSLGSEWDSHDNSLHHHIGRLGPVGDVFNFVYDLATFGVHSSYGKARDAHTSGAMSDADYSATLQHLALRTAAMAYVSLLTGGIAGRLVRGGAAGVSTARAIGAGTVAGAVGATTGLAASDAYNIFTGQQEGFSSPEDYIKTALVGGALGGVLDGALNEWSKRARAYVPEEAKGAGVERTGGANGDKLTEPHDRATGRKLELHEETGDRSGAVGPKQQHAERDAGKAAISPDEHARGRDKAGEPEHVGPGTQAKPASGRVDEPVPGLYDSVDPNYQPAGWQILDRGPPQPHPDHPELIQITTDVIAPNGKTGWIERSYDPKNKMVVMENAFLQDLPSWIDAGKPMVPNKGTPTVTYLTLRQMKLLGANFGEVKTIKMSTIQNIEAVMQLEQMKRAGESLEQAVPKTHSVQYATTSIEQSGHTITNVRIETSNAWQWDLQGMMDHFRMDPALRQKLFAKYGLGPTDTVLASYDIYIDVASHPKNP